jgi:hypothetical protein
MAKIDKILGSISPLYGAISGQGLFGNALAGFQDATKMGGVLPIIASEQRKKRRADEAARNAKDRDEPTDGMRRGGKVKKMAKGGSTASKRADGCAIKGKTKGRFV